MARRIREYGVKRPEWLTHCEICGCAIGDYKKVDNLIEVLDRLRARFPNIREDVLLQHLLLLQNLQLLQIQSISNSTEITKDLLTSLSGIWLSTHQVTRLVQCPICGRFVCVVPAAPELDCWDEKRGMCVLCAREMPRQKACPNCGAVMPQEARFCGICGHKLPE